LVLILAGLGIIAGAFFYGRYYYSKEKQTDRFLEVLSEKDAASLEKVLSSDDPDFEISKESIQPYVDYLKENDAFVEEIGPFAPETYRFLVKATIQGEEIGNSTEIDFVRSNEAKDFSTVNLNIEAEKEQMEGDSTQEETTGIDSSAFQSFRNQMLTIWISTSIS